jgi:hypothetical protein
MLAAVCATDHSAAMAPAGLNSARSSGITDGALHDCDNFLCTGNGTQVTGIENLGTAPDCDNFVCGTNGVEVSGIAKFAAPPDCDDCVCGSNTTAATGLTETRAAGRIAMLSLQPSGSRS